LRLARFFKAAEAGAEPFGNPDFSDVLLIPLDKALLSTSFALASKLSSIKTMLNKVLK
jgi:hypothetical protein